MNKKFSTLVAALLASGGLFYAVDAMILPADNGVAKTYVATSLRAGVAGYEVSTTTISGEAQVWTKSSNNLIIGSDGWALGTNGVVVKAANAATVTLDADNSLLLNGTAWTINGEKLYLWNAGVMVTDWSSLSEDVTIATAKDVVADLAAQSQKVVAVGGFTATWTMAATAALSPANMDFLVDTKKDGLTKVLSTNVAGITYYLKLTGTTDPVTLVLDKEGASVATIDASGDNELLLDAHKFNTPGSEATAGFVGHASGTACAFVDGGAQITNTSNLTGTVNLTDKKSSFAAVNSLSVTGGSATGVQLALGADIATAANASNTWTLADGLLSIGAQKLTVAGSDVSLGAGSVVALNEDGVLTVGGQAIYIASNGAFSTTATENKPAALYSVNGKEISAQPVTALSAAGSFVIAEKNDTKVGETFVKLTEKTTLEAGAPGSEYGDVTGVNISENGDLTILTDNVANLPAAITIVNGTQYLGEKDGKAVWKDIEANKKAWECAGSSWVLNNGKLYNLSLSKAGKVAYFAGIGEALTAGGVNVALSIGNQMIVGSTPITGLSFMLGRASLMTTNPTSCENPLLSGVSSDYILLGGEVGGVMYYIKNIAGDLTTDVTEADLWKVEKTLDTNNARYGYKFASRIGASTSSTTDNYLTIDGASKFAGWDYVAGLQMVAVDTNNGPIVLDPSTSKAKVDNSGAASTILGMYRSSLEQFTAKWLMHRYGSSFELNIVNKYKDIADKTIYGNEFDGADLVPVVKTTVGGVTKLEEVTPEGTAHATEKSFLLKKQGTELYVVLNVTDRWSNATSDFVDGGFKFELLSEENVLKVLAGNQISGKSYYPYFRINYLEGKTEYDAANTVSYDKVADNTPVFCVELGDKDQAFKYDLVNLETTAPSGHLDVFVTVNERCANNDARKPNVTFYTDDENIVRGEDATRNPLNYRYVNIAFKAGEMMQFENDDNDRVNLNGKVLGINQAGAKAVPTEKEYFLSDKAEGQWAVIMTDAQGLTKADKDGKKLADIDSRKFTFINRENPDVQFGVKTMHALSEAKFGKDVYAVEYTDGNAFGAYKNAAGSYINPDKRDTLVITAAKGLLKFAVGEQAKNDDSYAKWTKEELQDKTFQLSIDAASQLFVVENEGKDSHFLGLSTDEATDWRLVPFTAERVHDVDAAKYLTAGTDSVYVMAHPQYYKSSKFYAYDDTTAIVTYALQNIQNGEWLTYDPSQSQTTLSMICDPNSKKFTTDDLGEAYRFVLKEKAEGAQKIESGKFNIVGVDAWELGTNSKYVKGKEHYALDLSKKLYGAATYQKQGAVEVEKAYVQPTSNDIFTIASVKSAEYLKAEPNDTVRIFRAENEKDVLFEKGQFLNSGNIAQITDMAPALLLDSAYVERGSNNRYQYLIVVNPNYVEAIYDSKNHLIEPDTMYGRFLVNQIDSAVMVSKNHNNKFINDIEADRKELKLGFQYGYRTNDVLYLTEGEGGKVIEKIDLSTADFNKAKFAFKYVNEAVDDQFKVQTRWYDYDAAVKAGLDKKDQWISNNEGYLKVINGVVVVTDSYTNAEEFCLTAEASAPTANEGINTSEVSVIAKEGEVVINGAAGKTVVITNVLGQTIASTVLSSDNATIAAPAGVVVVAVEGEAAVKAIVK